MMASFNGVIALSFAPHVLQNRRYNGLPLWVSLSAYTVMLGRSGAAGLSDCGFKSLYC